MLRIIKSVGAPNLPHSGELDHEKVFKYSVGARASKSMGKNKKNPNTFRVGKLVSKEKGSWAGKHWAVFS